VGFFCVYNIYLIYLLAILVSIAYFVDHTNTAERQQRVGVSLNNAISLVRDARNSSVAAEHRNNFGKHRFTAAPRCSAAKKGKEKVTS